jgi:Recombinase
MPPHRRGLSGGPAGFGLRRLLIDEGRNPKGELGRGDRKSFQTDRVVLTPGPPDEIEHVHSIYSMFVEEGKSEREIALALNQRGIMSDFGRPWTRASIHHIFDQRKIYRQQHLQSRFLQIEAAPCRQSPRQERMLD